MANNAKQLMKPVRYNGEKLSALEAWQRIDALPEEFPLTTDEAALFLRRSVSTLERMRKEGNGPAYVQAGGPSAKGTNQKVMYYKQALIDWTEASTVSSSMEAAVRKGQTFATIFDLAEALPFYVDPLGDVESMAEDATVDLAVERLGQWDLVWMTPTEAAARRWSSSSAHKDFAGRVQSTLSQMQSGIASALEATDIAESLRG